MELQQIKPTRDHILVAVTKCPKEQRTANGIILNTTPTKPECKGKVLAVGPGRILNNGTLLPIHIPIGDIVLFYDYAGIVIKETDTEIYMLLKENDILACIQ